MTADPQSQKISESDRLEMATDEAIAVIRKHSSGVVEVGAGSGGAHIAE